MIINEYKTGKFAPDYPGPHKILALIYDGRNIKITFRRGRRVVDQNKLRRVRMEDPEPTAEVSEAATSII